MTRDEFITAATAHYIATEDGQIISKHRGIVLKQWQKSDRGEKTVTMTVDGVQKTILVHRFVACYFYGSSPLQVNHIDGDPSNNSRYNLEYTDQSENMRHYFKSGKLRAGFRHKLLPEHVRDIKSKKLKAKEYATKYDIRVDHVRDIWKGVYWGWLT